MYKRVLIFLIYLSILSSCKSADYINTFAYEDFSGLEIIIVTNHNYTNEDGLVYNSLFSFYKTSYDEKISLDVFFNNNEPPEKINIEFTGFNPRFVHLEDRMINKFLNPNNNIIIISYNGIARKYLLHQRKDGDFLGVVGYELYQVQTMKKTKGKN